MAEEPQCNGICVMASDVLDRAPADLVAYPHPDCELHSGPFPEPPEDEGPEPTCPVCGAYLMGCVRGCTARKPWGNPA